MSFHRELTTVTPFSSILALILFILIPIVAFAFGMQYQTLQQIPLNKTEKSQIIIPDKVQTLPTITIPTGTRAPTTSTQPENNHYICPTSSWVDCMPGPGPAKPQCEPSYLQWAKANCPGFEGAAL